MSRLALLATFLTFCVANTSIAETVTLDCKMTDLSRGGGWIPRVALVKVNTDSKAIQLLKPTSDQMNGQIDGAELIRDSADKLMLRWVVKGTRSQSNQRTVAFKFRASIKKATGDVSIVATPLGYRNSFHGKGHCDIR